MTYTHTHWWHRDGDRIVCELCPRRCVLPEGKRGFCFVRQNLGGEMALTTYGRSTGFCIDPIEKKPLNHFLPGTPILSFGTAGCNLGCKFCQNWDISKSRAIEISSDVASPEAIIEMALQQGVKSLAFTYNDPVIWAEYAIDCAKLARQAGIRTVAVTAGYITPLARPDFYKWMDAANVDLKAFTEEFYRDITLSHLEPVLDTLKWLKHESEVWFEITNLIIPGENDSIDEIARMSDWIVENLGPDVPLHFSAFHPDFKMLDTPPTPPSLLRRARQQALAAGLSYVYVGNVHDSEASSTYCPKCHALLIERDWYQLGAYNLVGNRCGSCGEVLPGVFSESGPGDWGPKRVPVSFTKSTEELLRIRREKSQEIRRKPVSMREVPRVNYSDEEKSELLRFAFRVAQAAVLKNGEQVELRKDLAKNPCWGVFVSLKRGKMLRACCGRWGEIKSLEDLLRSATEDSALRDYRLPSIGPEELALLSLEISLMHDPQEITAQGESRVSSVRVGEHGLVISHPESRGLLLPQVAVENRWDSKQFLEQVCRKAGLSENAWLSEESSLLTFRAEVFSISPRARELELEQLTNEAMAGLLAGANHAYHRDSSGIRMPALLAEKYAGTIGAFVETRSGRSAADFLSNASPLDIVSAVAQQLELDLNDPILTVVILAQPRIIRAEDAANRLRSIAGSVLLFQKGGKFSLSFPTRSLRERIESGLRARGATLEDWRNGPATIAAFESRVIRAQPAESGVRAPAVAGVFYPDDPGEISDYLNAAFCNRPSELKRSHALMLPHAGWKYSGQILSQTILDQDIPDLCFIIGPKHTRLGAKWSISSDGAWAIPGATIPVAVEIARDLTRALPGFILEREAHLKEHGVEVMLPFLYRLNSKLRIVPIALGSMASNEVSSFATLFASFLKTLSAEPLLIISSDMNHFEDLATTNRKDELAIERLLQKDAQGLLQVCERERISMCGVIPAALVLETLKNLGVALRPKLVARGTSAAVSGDSNSVVGYAGISL